MNEKVNEYDQHRSNWKRVHHTWGFWLFFYLMVLAVTYYIITADSAFASHKQMKQPSGNSRTL